MTLTLRIENFDVLENGGPTSVTVRGGTCCVGRGAAMDWHLPDPARHVSSHHFDVALRDGQFWLTDVSTNGTFLQGQAHRLGGPHPIRNGDRFTVGPYIVRAELAVAAAPPTPQPHRPGTSQLQTPPIGMMAPASEPDESDPWSQFDTPATPAARPPAPPSAPPPAPVPAQPSLLQSAPSLPPSPMPTLGQTGFTPPVPPAQPDASGAPASMPMPAPDPAPATPVSPERKPTAFGDVAVSPPVPAAPPVTADGAAVLQAFLEGAGLKPDAYAAGDPVALARDLGKVVRVSTTQMMGMLQDRAAVKQFTKGGERTMRSAIGNNPMKFLPDAEQAIEAMFIKPRDGFMTGPDGFSNAMEDVRAHQVAVFAALQPALAEVLAGLSPDEVQDTTSPGILGGSSKGKAWDTFVERWDSKADKGDNGMLDVFLAAFAKAYVKAMGRDGV